MQFQIFGWAFILGMIALSLMFLAGYGGMVSLVQMTVAGCAGYMMAISATSAVTNISLGWPWWLAVPVAIGIAVLFGTISGALAVRTEGIYTIMITLAIASAFFYFTRQNYTLFNGFSGFNSVCRPKSSVSTGASRRPFYYLTLLGMGDVLSYFVVLYVSRSPFGLALQGVRDNPAGWRHSVTTSPPTASRPMRSRPSSRLVAGILLTWQNNQISPGTAVRIGPVIDILVIAVVGGLSRPIGPFIGAFIYVLLRTFALDVLVAVGWPGNGSSC